MDEKWKLHRAGLYNFWYYDNEIFEFADGKLLLRGTNGSGKSVTMQSLLPVLLDGKKTPDRLDPFGSKSRRMADYLLGEKEVSDRDERTGYLFLEYKKGNSEQYITTGMGMQAKRNQPIKSWGFVITDNRRIGKDIEVWKHVTQNGQKEEFPCSQKEMENLISDGGEVVTTNQDYMKLVNKHVFGFESLESFDDLIKLLIQLRSPKLSKDFKPTVIYEILEEALPPLTEDDLRYLSESIEQMDQTKQQMEQLEREVQALEKLNNANTAYQERILIDQFTGLRQATFRKEAEKERINETSNKLDKLTTDIAEDSRLKEEAEIKETTLEDSKSRLEKHEVFKLEEELGKTKLEKNEREKEIGNKSSLLENKQTKEREAQQRIEKIEAQIYETTGDVKVKLEDLYHEAKESAFRQHELNVKDYMEQSGGIVFDNWKREITEHIDKLSKAFDVLKQKQALIEDFQFKNHELADQEKIKDDLEDDERKWQRVLTEEKQTLMNLIHEWREKHAEYDVTDEAMQKMMRLVDDLFIKVDFDEVKAVYQKFVQKYETKLFYEEASKTSELDQIIEERTKLQEEWKDVNGRQDPEPKRHEATQEAREQLEKSGISYAPFYELVEFNKEVPEDVKRRLESALEETGVLDALVTISELEPEHDRILISDPKWFTPTLRDFLQPDLGQTKIPTSIVEEVLQSIEMNGESPVYFSEDGSYRAGNVLGHAFPKDDIRFIGREARRRYRENLLANLKDQIITCSDNISKIEEEKRLLNDKITASSLAWESFPSSENVKESHSLVTKVQQNIHFRQEQISKMALAVSEIDGKIQAIKREVFQLTQGIGLQKEPEVYEKALRTSRDYHNNLDKIQLAQNRLDHLKENKTREQSTLGDLQFDIDGLKGDISVLESKQLRASQHIEDIEKQQELQGAEDIRREIREVTDALRGVVQEVAHLTSRLPHMEAEKKQMEEKIRDMEESHDFWSKMFEAWCETARKEWKRYQPQGAAEELTDDVMNDTINNKRVNEKTALEGNLTNLFYKLQPDLTEHKMTKFTEQSDLKTWMSEVTKEEWKPVIEQWNIKSTRAVIEFDKVGMKVTPAVLYEEVAKQYSMQENRLDELDKELYEEILLNSVGHKLRGRIRRAEKWTEEMKILMESRNTSSGLKFSIRWKPKSADSEQELDTSDLVRLLKQDARLLNEEDLKRITTHFRSKIQGAKQWLEEKGEGQTLLQVLKMVLDYRKWFSFNLYFERPNEKKRELTNHQFFKFSGGEKAMAMYIPLFTACYSRYQEAAPSAPYIISLDEAFAGVDENNINEMFEIVEQLGFNYIMNSQVLWGDYETVRSLSVCELVRPKNADFVSVIRYIWNGNELNLKLDGEGEEDGQEVGGDHHILSGEKGL